MVSRTCRACRALRACSVERPRSGTTHCAPTLVSRKSHACRALRNVIRLFRQDPCSEHSVSTIRWNKKDSAVGCNARSPRGCLGQRLL
eukprot:6502603-Pyramimonas_sp.AAC.1